MRQPVRRFLAPQARQGNGLGYLSKPQRPLPDTPEHPDPAEVVGRIAEARKLCDEPEAISDAIVAMYGKDARYYDEIRHAAAVEAAQQSRKLLTAEQRMAEIQRRAKLQHLNVSGELHIARKMLERAKAGGRREPPTLAERLAAIEAKIDGLPEAA